MESASSAHIPNDASAWIGCRVVHLTPPVVPVSLWPVQLEVAVRVYAASADFESFRNTTRRSLLSTPPVELGNWMIAARTASDDSLLFSTLATAVSCEAGASAGELVLKLRCEVPASVAGVARIAVVPLAASTNSFNGWADHSQPAALSVSSIPLLITPSAAAAQEMLSMFGTMQLVMLAEQAKQQHAPPVCSITNMPAGKDAAAADCWSEHFCPLLLDLEQVLPAKAARSSDHPAGQLLPSVLEFLAIHSCWCCVSYVLAEAYKNGLLSSVCVIEAARMRQLSISRQLGYAGYGTAAWVMSAMILAITEPGHSESKQVLEAPQASAATISSRVSCIENSNAKAIGTSSEISNVGHTEATGGKSSYGHGDHTTAKPVPAAASKPDHRRSVGSMAALLLMVLLAVLVPILQLSTQAAPAVSDVTAGTAAVGTAAQLPLLYCILLTAVLAIIMWLGSFQHQ